MSRKAKIAAADAELGSLTAELTAQMADLGLRDLWFFATEVLFPDEAEKQYYEPLHKPLCEWAGTDSAGTRKLLLMPRGHRKTYLITIAHAVWRITKDPNIRIILVSALDDTARYFTKMVKRQFQYNEHFLRVYPHMRVPKNKQFGRDYDFTHPARTQHNLIDPTFRSFYLGAPVAGRRCDILIADDPIEKRHVTTPEQADKALKDFNDLIPIVDKTGTYNMVYVIGTRWKHNDIYGAMLGEARGTDETGAERAVAGTFEARVRHCLENEDGSPVTDPKTEGKPIMPTVWPRHVLLAELEQYRIDPKRGEEDWWHQYMNVCVSPIGRKFEPEYFDTWIPRLPGGLAFSCFLVDSASKDEQVLMRGDFTVVLLAHFDVYGHLYISDGARSDAMRGMDLINELIAMHQRCRDTHGFSVTNLVKEKVSEDTFFGWVRAEFNRAHIPLTTFPLQVRGQGRKYVRIIEALQHPAMARHIHFIDGFPREVHAAIVDEAIHIGQWSHDDAIDALSLAYHPDVRVSPSLSPYKEWVSPLHARARQLSTADNNLAALRAPAEPQPWRARGYAREGAPSQPQSRAGLIRVVYDDPIGREANVSLAEASSNRFSTRPK